VLEIAVREVGDVGVLDARGRILIGEGNDRLQRELQLLIQKGYRKIVVNLDGVAQIDSSGINTLARHCTILARAQGSLKLVCPSGRVRNTLELMRLLQAIPAFDDEAAALASFR